MSAVVRRGVRRRAVFPLAVGGAILLLLLAVALSLTVGARAVDPSVVLDALLRPDPTDNDHVVVLTQRVPRTIIGLVAGAALALAGTVMQGLTRNPFADPGLLGVNAGAALGVMLAVSVLGLTQSSSFVWFAFVGAALAAVLVALIGSAGADGANPAKLALTGAAVTAGLTAVTWFVLVTDDAALDAYRYWSVGSLTGRDLDTVWMVIAPIAVGGVLALAGGRGLDLIALGEDTARGLGHNVERTRIVGIVAAVLLCGGATAIAGPIVFLGLMIPHALRALIGDAYPRLLTVGVFVGAAVLLVADVVGRLIAPPGEVQAGVVVAMIGAPVLVALVLRQRQVTL
ncbi:iron ABC transporter permease [Microbacterium sp. 18062]|uniref:FecCD family ABC transporter permease n=1 Tax=Microbacterium sp. 18062 TaxID=2681410 RepID=UPI00190F66D0|nr:iron ABC transporter permease [Microbacterium sp. 18062]